jgi:serine protease Do
MLKKGVSALAGVMFAGILAWSAPSFAAAGNLPDFTEVVEKVGPAVVNISTTQKAKPRSSSRAPHGAPGLPEGTPFDEFFRRFFGEEDGDPGEFDAKSLGSGFIISNDGYVLTNHHVIKDADEIIVRLNDRRELMAKLVGSDERADVALLKIDAQGLPVVKVGDSTRLRVGEWVLAIGSPFDFDHTVTAGIVSALGRNLPSENYVPFIQTDVAINPGNSGGPLLNLDGEVVGINAQIYSRTGGFMGLSFTIPINLAMDVKDQLLTKGHVTRGWLGVLIQDVTRELAESFGMERPEGALVSQVMADSPAAKAGFEVGDVIIEFNGKPVVNSAALPPMVGVSEVGGSSSVVVLRDGKRKELKAVIEELPGEEELQASKGDEPKHTELNRLAISVVDLTAEQRKELEIAENGVLVTEVQSGPAQRAGVRTGDVIMKLAGEEVRDAKSFGKAVKSLPEGKNIALLVQRRSGPVFLAMKIEGND